MSGIAELLERVKVAPGPDRELDAALYNVLVDDGAREAFKVCDYSKPPGRFIDRWHDGWMVGKHSYDEYAEDLDRYTASIDAALALVERCLPGWGVELWEPGKAWREYSAVSQCSLHRETPVQTWKESSATLPLAILAALLTALKDSVDARD